MTGPDIGELVRRSEEIYATRLRAVLEPEHMDEFVVIEPESGDYFLGRTLREAAAAVRPVVSRSADARHARVGHTAAIHFGMHVR